MKQLMLEFWEALISFIKKSFRHEYIINGKDDD